MPAIKSFSDFLVEETKEVVFTFGRFNPPTVGHEKLITKVASIAKGNNYRIYASQSSDPKKNPLDYATKIKVMRKMFPKHGRNIILDKNVKNALEVLTQLYDQGFTKVTMVVGSDRVNEFTALANKYNGQKLRHGFYNFEGGVNVVSAGERDPDAEGVEGMSASKMRAAAADNDFSSFSKGLPSGFKGGQELFDTLRNAMGIKESSEYHRHIQLEPISEKREAFVKGELFEVGNQVVIKESGEVGTVSVLGANYVIVETTNGRYRKWLDAVESIDEKAAYHKGLAPSTKDKRQAQFNKQAKMDDDDPNAYKPAPGDARAETKPSKHTKKFKDMFGEELKESDTKKALQTKADKSGMPYAILKQVFDRGVAAWKSGHRPGTTPAQWGFARVNSFATKSKGTWGGADKDLADKVRG